MEKIKENKIYKIVDGDKTVASSFCGVVPDGVVNKIQTIPMNDSNTKTIMGFYTDINHRGKGFGKELLKWIIESEREAKTKYLTLGVEKNNVNAIALYKNCGFVIEGICGRMERMHFMYIEL